MTKPRILFVSTRIPFPANSGTKIRIYNLIHSLAGIGEIDLVGYAYPSEIQPFLDRKGELPAFLQQTRSFKFLPYPDWTEIQDPRYTKRIMSGFMRKEGLMYSTLPGEPLMRHCQTLAEQADLIWVERLYAARWFKQFGDKVIVDLDDLESVKLSRQADSESSALVRYMKHKEANKLARMEREATHIFSNLVVCSEGDREFFTKNPEKVWVLANGVDDTFLDAAPIPKKENHLVFVGTMNYAPNEDAMLYFCKEIFPLILQQSPLTTLAIVGLNPPSSIQALHNGTSISVHGNVPSIVPFVQEASASIVPLRVGGGTRLKILESMALGTPVVSTTIGAEGIELENNIDILLADKPHDFAKAVVNLLKDTGRQEAIITRGREKVKKQYLWSSIRKKLVQLVLDRLKTPSTL